LKIKQGITFYAIIVLAFATVLIANNQINKNKVPSTTADKTVSQQALSDTSVKTTDTTQTKVTAPTTTNTTVKPSTKTSTVSTPKTTVKASTTTTATAATETPTEPVTPPQPTEQERVYNKAGVDASKESSNSPYTVTLDKTSLPDGSSINIEVSPLERWSASVIVIQALTSSGGMFCANTQGSWLLNPDGKTYSNTYKDNVGIAFNGSSTINLYVIIKLKDGTFYQYKYTLTKTN